MPRIEKDDEDGELETLESTQRMMDEHNQQHLAKLHAQQEAAAREARNLERAIELEQIFAQIRCFIGDKIKREPEIEAVYIDLQSAINLFAIELSKESPSNKPSAISTANKLATCLQVVLAENSDPNAVTQSIKDFRNYARNAEFSIPTKMTLGGVIGAILCLAAVLAIVIMKTVLTAGLGLVFIVLPLVVGLVTGGVGGAISARVSAEGQNDDRAHGVYKSLKNVSVARQGLFNTRKHDAVAPDQPQQDVNTQIQPPAPTASLA